MEPDEEVDRRYARMPASLERALAAFQRDGVRFAIARRGRALIGDEMGARPAQQLDLTPKFDPNPNSNLAGECRCSRVGPHGRLRSWWTMSLQVSARRSRPSPSHHATRCDGS